MRIQIDLLDEPESYDLQLLAINEYIKRNTISRQDYNFLGGLKKKNELCLFSKIVINETFKNTSVIITPKDTWRKFYVSCKRTNTMYKFNIRNAN